MNHPLPSTASASSSPPMSRRIRAWTLAAAATFPALAWAQVGDTGTKVCGFFENINSLLNAASVVVVTIAVIFSGYQIAFAHKRIADVAPALTGGVLIGAAAQVAKMVVGGNGSGSGAKACTPSSGGAFLMDVISTALQLLPFHA